MVAITDAWLERAVEQMASGELGGMFVNRDDITALIRECQRLRGDPLGADNERLADAIHEARCGPVLWRGDEHVEWTDDHREWDIATAKALGLLGVTIGPDYRPLGEWTTDSAGYVRAPLVNRGTLDG